MINCGTGTGLLSSRARCQDRCAAPISLTRHPPAGAQIENALAPLLQKSTCEDEVPERVDMLGSRRSALVIAGASPAGRPRLPIGLMCSILNWKHAVNLSDEQLCARGAENVVWQYSSVMDYYQPRLPCDATQIGRFRTDMGGSLHGDGPQSHH